MIIQVIILTVTIIQIPQKGLRKGNLLAFLGMAESRVSRVGDLNGI